MPIVLGVGFGVVTGQKMRLLPFICFYIFLCSAAQAIVVRTPALIQAVQSGHMPRIGQLIRGGTEINAINAWGRTATHYAVSRNNQKALKLLLDHGADANLADNDGNTPLDMWHKHKNEEMLALLQAAGARPSFTKVEEQQPAIAPATNTAPSSTEFLSEDKVENQDLWQAAADNDRLSAERLLAAGADAKAENDAGKVPFEIAVEAEHAAVAAILLRAAAGVNGEDKKRWKPLHWAIVADEWDLVKAFIEEGADLNAGRHQSVLDIAMQMEDELQLIKVFIAVKSVDTTFAGNRTVLMWAVRYGQTEAVKLLVEKGADLNIQSKSGETALMSAARTGRTEIVKILVEGGADLNIQDYQNEWTALMEAARYGHKEIVKILIDNGADLDSEDWIGTTALMYAVATEQRGMVKYLIDNGANPNYKNSYGDTALGIAERNGYQEIIDILRTTQQGSM